MGDVGTATLDEVAGELNALRFLGMAVRFRLRKSGRRRPRRERKDDSMPL
jgi:alpha-acetolactate decarboxylase